MHSELTLLQAYGPNVSVDILKRLTRLFNDLRTAVDEGQLSYPYSTRELVNLVKHIQSFPDDSLLHILENVFSFDLFHPQLREHLVQTFQKHGIPLGLLENLKFSIAVGKETLLSPPVACDKWVIGNSSKFDAEVRKVLHFNITKMMWFQYTKPFIEY